MNVEEMEVKYTYCRECRGDGSEIYFTVGNVEEMEVKYTLL